MYKSKLKRRIMALENELGLKYSDDGNYWGAEHTLPDNGYGKLCRIMDRLKALERKVFPNK